MEFVGTGLGDHLHLHGIAAVFRAEIRRRHVELRDSIWVWNCSRAFIADRV